MKLLIRIAVMVAVFGTPAWAGESGGFDPEQPFAQGLGQKFLKSILGQALDALEEHFEISGSLNPETAGEDRKLQFKFYPEGKSKSREHIAAEGWFGPSKDSSQEELHFRFALPKTPSGPTVEQLDNVL